VINWDYDKIDGNQIANDKGNKINNNKRILSINDAHRHELYQYNAHPKGFYPFSCTFY